MANIFHIEQTDNKITLGTTGTTINIASHTASKLLALDASKDLEVVTIGSSLDYTRPTLNTVQDIRTSASPQLAGIELGHASDTTLTRVSAGVVAIEGTNIAMVGGAHHDEFSDFVANKHIDHTSVTLTAGTGLTGGGDISANRTFAVDGLLEDLDTLGANSADSEFLVGTGAGALAWENAATARTSLGLVIGTDVQAYDVELASLAALSYVAASFVKMTGANTFALRTIGETADDLEATIDHDNLANGGAHDYAYISGNDGITGITAAELEELSDGSETALHSHIGFSAYTNEDSESDAMIINHAYKAATDGFVSASVTLTTVGHILSGYVGLDNNPLDEHQVGSQEADAENSYKSIFFAVAKDEYFEIRSGSGTPIILWKSKGVLSKPIDQD